MRGALSTGCWGADWLRAKFFHLAARVGPAPEREEFRQALARLDALPIRC